MDYMGNALQSGGGFLLNLPLWNSKARPKLSFMVFRLHVRIFKQKFNLSVHNVS